MSIPIKLIIYQVNDQFIEVTGLVNSLDDADFFNAATVTATLRDSAGNSVVGITGLVLDYVAASDGVYRGVIQETVSPTLGGGYILQVTASEGGVVGNWFIKCKVVVRTLET